MKRLLTNLFLVLTISVSAQIKIPEHGGVWVHDDANVLSAGTRSELEYILKAHRDSTSNQIAVLIVPTLEGDDIDDYANRVFREWKLGDAAKDNGVLFLIAINDRKMRIEVGLGLEGVLTDALSSRINRNEVAPFFRQVDYDGGIRAGTLAIISAIKGEYKNDNPKGKKGRSPLLTLLIIIIFIIIASRRNKRGGGGYWSSGGGYMGPMIGGSGFGGSSSSWSGSDFGGGGDSGGGGSSDSW